MFSGVFSMNVGKVKKWFKVAIVTPDKFVEVGLYPAVSSGASYGCHNSIIVPAWANSKQISRNFS